MPVCGQIKSKNWRFGIAARDITSTFNAWSFTFTEKEKEVLYLTNNEIPVKSTELTAPRLVLGIAREFEKVGQKSSLLAEANIDLTFDGQRNTVISADPVSADPKLGLELNINNVFFLRGGINNFQKALYDGDTVNQKKVSFVSPVPEPDLRFRISRLIMLLLIWPTRPIRYLPMFFLSGSAWWEIKETN